MPERWPACECGQPSDLTRVRAVGPSDDWSLMCDYLCLDCAIESAKEVTTHGVNPLTWENQVMIRSRRLDPRCGQVFQPALLN